MSETIGETIERTTDEVFVETSDNPVERSLGVVALHEHDNSDDLEEQFREIKLNDDPVRDYLQLIGRRPILKAEQEASYARAIEVGLFAEERIGMEAQALSSEDRRDLMTLVREGKQANDIMIESNLRLVVSIAKGFRDKGLDFLELIQEGNLGLMHAVEKFDYQQGFKFSTYATWWIRQTITRVIADKARLVRIPVHEVEKTYQTIKKYAETDANLSNHERHQLVADELEISVEKVVERLGRLRDPLSLQALIGEEDSAELGDLLVDERVGDISTTSEQAELVDSLEAALRVLTEEEAAVIKLRHGLSEDRIYTLPEVGEMLGRSPEMVRQIQSRAMRKLRLTVSDSLKELISS